MFETANFCKIAENSFVADVYLLCYHDAPSGINFTSVVFT